MLDSKACYSLYQDSFPDGYPILIQVAAKIKNQKTYYFFSFFTLFYFFIVKQQKPEAVTRLRR